MIERACKRERSVNESTELSVLRFGGKGGEDMETVR
jgi:hypothetical protein